jgi:hypothetical protein
MGDLEAELGKGDGRLLRNTAGYGVTVVQEGPGGLFRLRQGSRDFSEHMVELADRLDTGRDLGVRRPLFADTAFRIRHDRLSSLAVADWEWQKQWLKLSR